MPLKPGGLTRCPGIDVRGATGPGSLRPIWRKARGRYAASGATRRQGGRCPDGQDAPRGGTAPSAGRWQKPLRSLACRSNQPSSGVTDFSSHVEGRHRLERGRHDSERGTSERGPPCEVLVVGVREGGVIDPADRQLVQRLLHAGDSRPNCRVVALHATPCNNDGASLLSGNLPTSHPDTGILPCRSGELESSAAWT